MLSFYLSGVKRQVSGNSGPEIMLSSYHAERSAWEDGLRAFDACEYEIAVHHFEKIGSLSKAHYNIGIAQVAQGDNDNAVTSRDVPLCVTILETIISESYFS